MLTSDELKRYKRQIGIFSKEGQRKLRKAKVFIAGAGGLGSSISVYLVVAGIGKLRMVDDDIVALENLNRQILHWDNDIGRKKLESAAEKLKRMNCNVEVETIAETMNEDNVDELIGDCDMIVDAMDNFAGRYVLNKAALIKKTPLFHGAVHGFYGLGRFFAAAAPMFQYIKRHDNKFFLQSVFYWLSQIRLESEMI